MKTMYLFIVLFYFSGFLLNAQPERLVSEKSHIKFFSTTLAEDIEAHNYSSTSTLNIANGNVVFSVPMQGFEFEKRLMQRHFNQKDFLHTSEYPNARLVAKIKNLDAINFAAMGTYPANVEGELTIRGVTKMVREKGEITVNGSKITVNSVFNVTLADYGITFDKGKPASNIAKSVEVTVNAEYQPQ